MVQRSLDPPFLFIYYYLKTDYNTNFIIVVSSGKLQPNGDKDKAMKALYEVVVGEGAGKGREAERLLPLGQDMTLRLKGQLEYFGHALEVFGDVTDNVAVDKK